MTSLMRNDDGNNKKQSKYGYEVGYCDDVTSSNDESFCIDLATKRQVMITSHQAMISTTPISAYKKCVLSVILYLSVFQ
jgi:hypothetical protein